MDEEEAIEQMELLATTSSLLRHDANAYAFSTAAARRLTA